MALARIRQLGAHEIGHTIGFAHNYAASAVNRASVMDYPHPQFNLKGNEIDLSNAYAIGIGDWDKVSVAYSYTDFGGKEDRAKLMKILEDAEKQGLLFITDYDARMQSGAHATAHLWDNGTSASEELNDILKVREVAIANFSKDNIPTNVPYSTLEDVFVPLYFAHRYQVEAATKLIGGMHYNYALKGTSEFQNSVLDKASQKSGLQAVLNSISAKALAIPKETLKLFPPRAFGYGKTRESFKGKTGVSFDPLSAASTASDLSLKLLLNPERMNLY